MNKKEKIGLLLILVGVQFINYPQHVFLMAWLAFIGSFLFFGKEEQS